MSERTYTWLDQKHPISGADISDRQVASRIRGLMRHEICFEGVLLLARDRIVCLSEEKAKLESDLLAARSEAEDTHKPEVCTPNLHTLVKLFIEDNEITHEVDTLLKVEYAEPDVLDPGLDLRQPVTGGPPLHAGHALHRSADVATVAHHLDQPRFWKAP